MAIRHFRYGPRRSQTADLAMPDRVDGPVPVVVLIHGGFWRARMTKVIMHPMMRALAHAGFAVWNIEYRRVGRGGGGGGVPETLEDVALAIDALADVEGIELGAIVTCGHSAGGHLAIWAASRERLGDAAPGGRPRIHLDGALSLCGSVDLDGGLAAGIGNGAVRDFLGGRATEHDAKLRLAAPLRNVPLGVPQVLLHGLDDPVVPAAMSESYVRQAVAAGDDATFVGLPGVGHGEVINPHSDSFDEIVAILRRLTAVHSAVRG